MSNSERFGALVDALAVWRDHLDELEKENQELKLSRGFYKCRCELLSKVQQYMRDPERQIVCDILANCSLLDDPSGERYGVDIWPLVKPRFFPKDLEALFPKQKGPSTETSFFPDYLHDLLKDAKSPKQGS